MATQKKATKPGKKPAKKQTTDSHTALTDRQKTFVDEYLIDLNATQAAIRAGYGEKNARQVAAENLSKPYIHDAIAQAMKDREQRTEITQDRVLREWWNMLIADTNDLVEHRRGCCRHCYGIDFGYQRTVQEMNAARRNYEKARMACKNQEQIDALGDFDEMGGIGYDARKPPNPDCQECFGDGEGRVLIKDTRNLPQSVKALYAGIKQTKEGIEVKMHSKDKAMEMLARHLGLFKTDNEQKSSALSDLIQLVQERSGKLPIKE